MSDAAVLDLILSPREIEVLTGYKRAADQLSELHRQGFHRARRARVTLEVVLERAHYDAVCSGYRPTRESEPEPQPLSRRRPTLRTV